MAVKDKSRNTETGRRLEHFNSVVGKEAPEIVLSAAKDLWSCPSYEQDLEDSPLRDSYIDALFDIANVFRNIPDYRVFSSYGINKPPLPGSIISSRTIEALKRAYSLDDGHIRADRNSSAKEAAAFKLGLIYEQARCHNTAAFWFRRSLLHARSVGGATEQLLPNLCGLARNLNTAANYDEAGPCYDEILTVLEDIAPADRVPNGLAYAALYHLQHRDHARGEAIMRSLHADVLQTNSMYFGTSPIPLRFAAALHALGMHYIATGRAPDAIVLARDVVVHANRFERPDDACQAMHGLAAKAYLDQRNLDAALAALDQIHDVNATRWPVYDEHIDQTTLELWLDVARIHVARHRYGAAMIAYQILASYLGARIADRDQGNTTRLRMHWLERMAFVVHEMASVWLNIASADERRPIERVVATALLQVKTNLFTAIEKSKSTEVMEITDKAFMANRRYAAAARRVAAQPDDEDAVLELEAALLDREQHERIDLPFQENQLVPLPITAMMFGFLLPVDRIPLERPFSPAAGLMATLVGDVSQLVDRETVFVDYSVINFQPPHEGRQGPSQGRRYLGVGVRRDEGYRLRDLGDATEIETQCGSFIRACSAPGTLSEKIPDMPQSTRHFVTGDSAGRVDGVDFDRLAGTLYDQLLAPFEPLERSLIVSPDGMLSAVPFHALVRNDRWLVEETEVRYCHSLHLKATLTRRQCNPDTRRSSPSRKVALVLGNPKYEGRALAALPGTKLEIAKIEKLLTKMKAGDEPLFAEVRVLTGPVATASQLIGVLPRVIHIAAHGGVEREAIERFRKRPMRFGEYYRAWDEMGSLPMTALDDGLLRCELRLAKEKDATGDPAGGAVLTALELSSLNLLGCHAVVLSACETGAGVPLHGAGALGFQYAVQATCARAGLVSLWKVLDHETAILMADFYKEFLRFHQVGSSYMTTMRRFCRRDGQRVHPYYWAAFVFIDGELDDLVPW
jgi:CHAT domain-containing protein/tetratricopeptide (TPR) repeat protein